MALDEKQKFIFGSIFLIANKLQAIGDQYLGEDGMTTRQWFLSIMIAQFENQAPTLTEVAQVMGSSHQNVKQLALKLEKKGFIRIDKDPTDGRAIRLSLTPKCRAFWMERREKDDAFIRNLFNDIDEDELEVMQSAIKKILRKIIQNELTGVIL